jgi:hypothetical protein
MLPQDIAATLTTIADWALYVALVALVVLVPLHMVERRRCRHCRHEFDQLIARHHNLRDAHERLRDEYGGATLTPDDRALLEALAAELVSALVSVDGEPVLSDAEAVHRAIIPVPVVEIEYPDRLVKLHLTVEHYGPDAEGAEEGEVQA